MAIRSIRVRPTVPGPNTSGGCWTPPVMSEHFESNWIAYFRWEGGRATSIQGSQYSHGRIVSEATVFTGQPSQNLWAVPLNVMTTNVANNDTWRQLHFDRKPLDQTTSHFCFVDPHGSSPQVQGRGTINQLLPDCYDCPNPSTNRRNRGFIGPIAIMIALAAFSGRTNNAQDMVDIITRSLRPNLWRAHNRETGRGEYSVLGLTCLDKGIS